MMKTQLDKQVCFQVWNLANPSKSSTFTKAMFFTAMHIMYKKRQNPNLELPTQVPPELSVSAAADSEAN